MRTSPLDNLIEIVLAVGYVIGNSRLAALIVFGLAYAQQIAFWSWSISLGPDFYVAAGMALFAFCVTAWSILKEG